MRGWKTKNDQNSVLANLSKGNVDDSEDVMHLKMKLRVSVIISQLFQVILPAKIYSKYPGIKIGISGLKVREKKREFVIISSLPPHNCKLETHHFTSWKGRRRTAAKG